MKLIRQCHGQHAVVIALYAMALTAAAPAAFSAEDAATHDHTKAVAGATAKEDAGATSDMMQNMRAMHTKMMAANTPAERAALLPDQMAMMQKCMDMMKGAHGDSAMRMDMMQMMMQMMMDRMAATATEATKPGAPK